VSPAAFDLQDGRCLNDPARYIGRKQNNNVPASESPRGCELHRIGSQVFVSGKPYYAHPHYSVYDGSVTNKTVYTHVGGLELAWFNNAKLACYDGGESAAPEVFARAWGKPEIPGRTPRWTHATRDGQALAAGKNAAVVATATEVRAIGLNDGRQLWIHPLPAPPVPWGLALTRDGRVLVALEDGAVMCLE